jgi:hypothetical protein
MFGPGWTERTWYGLVAMNRDGIAAAVEGRVSLHPSVGGGILGAAVTLISGAPRVSSAARVGVVLLVFVWCAVWAAPAAATGSYGSAGGAPASQVVLGSSFQSIRPGAVLARGDYLLRSTTVSNGFPFAAGWIVINTRLGTTTALDPECHVLGLGPPWVLMSCPQSSDPNALYDVELYSLADGTRQTVTPSPGMAYCSSPPYDPEVTCSADAVGAYWIEWVASSYHHLPTSVYFQNIQTGEHRGDPTNATTLADLNSPALAHQTCLGVSRMRGYSTVWGSLTLDGQFALVTGSDNSVYLERCGTRMRRLLANGNTVVSYALASNAGAIVWQAVTSRLDGLLLPSLQRFTIPLPSAIVRPPGSSEDTIVGGLELTSGALYVSEGDGTVWRTASPTAMPRNTSRPRLTRSGSTLTCRRGSWRNASRFAYTWLVNGIATSGASRPRLTVGKARKRRSVSCSVTASNAAGTTTTSSAQLHLR